MKHLFALTTLLCSSLSAHAEYRAFQYMVKSNDPYARATNASAQLVVSTLNPKMFKSYHGGHQLTVDLLRTWVCPGYTGRYMATCPHPYDKVAP